MTAADELAASLGSLALTGPSPAAPKALATDTAPAAPQGTGGGSSGPTSSKVAGGGAAMEALRELIVWPVKYAEQAAALGLSWPRGILLHGPPGCGKTLMVQTVAEECGAAMHVVSAGDVFGAYLGEAERRLRDAFEAAARDAAAGRVAVVFLDEVDALCPRRDASRQLESRVVAQLLTLMDGGAALPSAHSQGARAAGSSSSGAKAGGHLVVVGATNRPNALDPALRRPGRLDREVVVGVPDTQQRASILGLHLSGLKLEPGLDLTQLAASCHGYSGADLAALARETALAALARAAAALLPAAPEATPLHHQQQQGEAEAAAPRLGGWEAADWGAGALPDLVVRPGDVAAAMRRVGPSIVRGIEVEVPHTSWADVGGLPGVKQRLQQAVEWPLSHRGAFERLGLTPPRGVLLYGPPGCSKTSLARAAACASRATLIPLGCAQLFSMYVGEGEAMVRDVFRRARAAAPSIVLLDEVDAVAARREEGADAGGGGGSEAGVRLLTTLLTEMDGMEQATGVLVLGATNRPAAVDAALMRPGRFDVLLYVPPPDMEGRLEVLRIHTRKMPLAPDVDLAQIAADTEGFTGAELASLCGEAALAAMRDDGGADGRTPTQPEDPASATATAATTPTIAASANAVALAMPRGADQVGAKHFSAARAASRAPAVGAAELAIYEQWGKARGSGKGK